MKNTWKAIIVFIIAFQASLWVYDDGDLFRSFSGSKKNLNIAAGRKPGRSEIEPALMPEIYTSNVSAVSRQYSSIRKFGIAILTGGKRSSYVLFQKLILERLGANGSDIKVFLDDAKYSSNFESSTLHVIDQTKLESGPRLHLTAIYLYLLDVMFLQLNYEHVIVLEDDIFPGADFMQFMHFGTDVMKLDDSVVVVSGSNDNADKEHQGDRTLFKRANHLLGLGWMTSNWVYRQVIRKAISKCIRPWDVCVSIAVTRHKSNSGVTLYPDVPRSLHVPYSQGRYAYLAAYQLTTSRFVEDPFPPPENLTSKYYKAYIAASLCGRSHLVTLPSYKNYISMWNKKLNAMKSLKLRVPVSQLSQTMIPHGSSAGIAIYPALVGDSQSHYLLVDDSNFCSAKGVLPEAKKVVHKVQAVRKTSTEKTESPKKAVDSFNQSEAESGYMISNEKSLVANKTQKRSTQRNDKPA